MAERLTQVYEPLDMAFACIEFLTSVCSFMFSAYFLADKQKFDYEFFIQVTLPSSPPPPPFPE